MFKVKANNGTTLEVKNTLNKVFINNEEIVTDILNTGDNQFHIIYKNQSFSLSANEIDHENKTCTITINGKKIHFELKDDYAELLEKMGMASGTSKKVNEFKAPMPGLVLRLLVKEGDMVKKGDGLLILEAMKMENILKSVGEGVVKKIHVAEKGKVEKGQLLLSF